MSDKYKFQPTGNAALDAKLASIYQWANEKHDAIKRWNYDELNRIRVALIEQEGDLESDLIDRIAEAQLEAAEAARDLQDG